MEIKQDGYFDSKWCCAALKHQAQAVMVDVVRAHLLLVKSPTPLAVELGQQLIGGKVGNFMRMKNCVVPMAECRDATKARRKRRVQVSQRKDYLQNMSKTKRLLIASNESKP